jgi:sugar phosphate isomerase/epimerase
MPLHRLLFGSLLRTFRIEFCAVFPLAVYLSDERIMPRSERKDMIKKLKEMGYDGYLEEERCDPYPSSITRLQKAGFTIF